MKIIGLTGSIGMGKSETARMFEGFGVPVYDADAAVHEIYKAGGEAVPLIRDAFGDDVIKEGAVDRQKLASKVLNNREALKHLEEIVHPLVAAVRLEALKKAEAAGADLIVLDIPLLFESGGKTHVDYSVVVSAPFDIQKERVLERPGMTEEKFNAIVEKQMPDSEKRALADFIVETDKGLDHARAEVKKIIETLRLKNK